MTDPMEPKTVTTEAVLPQRYFDAAERRAEANDDEDVEKYLLEYVTFDVRWRTPD